MPASEVSSYGQTLPDFYELLEARDDANDKELQRSFRRQAIKFHPDKNPTAEAASRFHLLQIALDTLTDNEKRRIYDEERKQIHQAKIRREQVAGERRAWIDELEKGEQAATMGGVTHDRGRTEKACREIELSRQGAKLRADLAERSRKRHRASDLPHITSKVLRSDHITKDANKLFVSEDKTLKVRFRGQVDVANLKAIFSKVGNISEIIYRPSDRKTQSALIEFSQLDGAYNASIAPTISWAGIDVREVAWAYSRKSQECKRPSGPVKEDIPGIRPFSFSMSGNPESRSNRQLGGEFENLVLSKMRQRQKELDREKAERQSCK